MCPAERPLAVCACVCVPTCAGSSRLGKMALTGLSRGDRHEFSLECLCFSAIWGEPAGWGGRQVKAMECNVDRVEARLG